MLNYQIKRNLDIKNPINLSELFDINELDSNVYW